MYQGIIAAVRTQRCCSCPMHYNQLLGVFFPMLDYETLRTKPKRFNNMKRQMYVPGNNESAAAEGEEAPARSCSTQPLSPPAWGLQLPLCRTLLRDGALH